MGGERLAVEAGQEVDRRPETDRAGEVRRAGLELVGGVVVDGLLEADRQDHVAAALIGGHLLEQLAPAVEDADAGRPVHLVAGQARRNRSRAPARRWGGGGRPARRRRGRGPPRRGRLGDLPDRVDRAEHVGDVGDRDELGPLADQRLELVDQELASVVDRCDPQPGARPLADICQGTMLEWCSISVMSTSSPSPRWAAP